MPRDRRQKRHKHLRAAQQQLEDAATTTAVDAQAAAEAAPAATAEVCWTQRQSESDSKALGALYHVYYYALGPL